MSKKQTRSPSWNRVTVTHFRYLPGVSSAPFLHGACSALVTACDTPGKRKHEVQQVYRITGSCYLFIGGIRYGHSELCRFGSTRCVCDSAVGLFRGWGSSRDASSVNHTRVVLEELSIGHVRSFTRTPHHQK